MSNTFSEIREMNSTGYSKRTGKPDYEWINKKYQTGGRVRMLEHVCPDCFGVFWTDTLGHGLDEYACAHCGNHHSLKEFNSEYVFMDVKTRYRGHS